MLLIVITKIIKKIILFVINFLVSKIPTNTIKKKREIYFDLL